MVRENVEKIRGMIFTPEELQEIVLPAIEESSSKLFHNDYETGKLIENCLSRYTVLEDSCKKSFTLYHVLRNMADSNPEKLVGLWDKVLEERELKFPEDIDKEVFTSFQIGSPFAVYNDTYVVDRKDDHTIYFKREDE